MDNKFHGDLPVYETHDRGDSKIPQHIRLTKEWLDKWLPVLNERELKAYLKLAYHYNPKTKITFPSQSNMADAMGKSTPKTANQAISQLEEYRLIDIRKRQGKSGWPRNEYRMLYVDNNGYHRGDKQRESILDIVADFNDLFENYLEYSIKYPTYKELRSVLEKEHPEYIEKYDEIHNDESDKESMTHLELEFLMYIYSKLRWKYRHDEESYELANQEISSHIGNLFDKSRSVLDEFKNDIREHFDECFNSLHQLHRAAAEFQDSDKSEFNDFIPDNLRKTRLWDICQKHGLHPVNAFNIIVELIEESSEVIYFVDKDNKISDLCLPVIHISQDEEDLLYPAYIEDRRIIKGIKKSLDSIMVIRKKYFDSIVDRLLRAESPLFKKHMFPEDGSDEINSDLIEDKWFHGIPNCIYGKSLSRKGMLKLLVYKLNKIIIDINESCSDFNEAHPEVHIPQMEMFSEDYLINIVKEKEETDDK